MILFQIFKYLTVILIILILSVCCSKDDIIPEDDFVKIYVEMLVTQDTLSDKSITPDSLRSIVLSRHNIQDSEYRHTIEYYNSSPDRWEKFFKKATDYVNELKAKQKD